MEAGEQLAGIDSLPLFCGSRVVSGHQVWGQVALPTKLALGAQKLLCLSGLVALTSRNGYFMTVREPNAFACLTCVCLFVVFEGGYETFYSQYPECCVDVKPASQEKTESERGLLGQCGKPTLSVTLRPAYDQVCDSRLCLCTLSAP